MKRQAPLSESAIRRVLRGQAYHRGKVERRGRPKRATPKAIKTFEKTRKKLLKKAMSKKRATYADVLKEAGLEGEVSARRIQPAVKEAEDIELHKARQSWRLTGPGGPFAGDWRQAGVSNTTQ